MSHTDISSTQRRCFEEGEPVIVIEPEGRRHYVRLRKGSKFHHVRTGHISHDLIIGQPPGVLLKSETGRDVVCLRMTVEDFILKKLRRCTSIIHPKDLATLLIRGDVFPGARVLEAGIGSGSASIILLRHIGPGGLLISYETRERFLQQALENIDLAHSMFGNPGSDHRAVSADVYSGIEEENLDLILLDVPEPHRVVPHACSSLRPGGILMSWLPTVTQVYILARELAEDRQWSPVETREVVERNWETNENAMRPYHRMVGHTGFFIRARKLEIVE